MLRRKAVIVKFGRPGRTDVEQEIHRRVCGKWHLKT